VKGSELDEAKEEEYQKKMEKQLADRKKKLQEFLSYIEEDDLPDLDAEENTMEEKKDSKDKGKTIQWDKFYSSLS